MHRNACVALCEYFWHVHDHMTIKAVTQWLFIYELFKERNLVQANHLAVKTNAFSDRISVKRNMGS